MYIRSFLFYTKVKANVNCSYTHHKPTCGNRDRYPHIPNLSIWGSFTHGQETPVQPEYKARNKGKAPLIPHVGTRRLENSKRFLSVLSRAELFRLIIDPEFNALGNTNLNRIINFVPAFSCSVGWHQSHVTATWNAKQAVQNFNLQFLSFNKYCLNDRDTW